jgi:hypothetical protein
VPPGRNAIGDEQHAGARGLEKRAATNLAIGARQPETLSALYGSCVYKAEKCQGLLFRNQAAKRNSIDRRRACRALAPDLGGHLPYPVGIHVAGNVWRRSRVEANSPTTLPFDYGREIVKLDDP